LDGPSEDPVTGRLTALAVEAAALGVDIITLGRVLSEGRASAHVEPTAPFRTADAFELLRDRSDAQRASSGQRPTVAVVCLGPLGEHTARATWVVNALAAGGIEARVLRGFEDARGAAAAFEATGLRVAVVAGADSRYTEEAPAVL